MVSVEFVVAAVIGRLFVPVILRSVVAQYVFQTGLQSVYLAKGRGVVHLEGVLCGVLVAVVVLVLQAFQEAFPAIGGLHVKIIGVRVRLVWLSL